MSAKQRYEAACAERDRAEDALVAAYKAYQAAIDADRAARMACDYWEYHWAMECVP